MFTTRQSTARNEDLAPLCTAAEDSDVLFLFLLLLHSPQMHRHSSVNTTTRFHDFALSYLRVSLFLSRSFKRSSTVAAARRFCTRIHYFLNSHKNCTHTCARHLSTSTSLTTRRSTEIQTVHRCKLSTHPYETNFHERYFSPSSSSEEITR